MTKEIKESIKILKESKDILYSLYPVQGFYTREVGTYKYNAINENSVFHKKLKEKFINKAMGLLSDKDSISLKTKFNHQSHFLEGVTKQHALYYYFSSPDFNMNLDGAINGGVGKVTKAMRNFYNTLIAIKRDVKNGIYLEEFMLFIESITGKEILEDTLQMKYDIYIQGNLSKIKNILPIKAKYKLTQIKKDVSISFNEEDRNIILKYLYHNKAEAITKDNIHLYYKFMSDEDKKKNIAIVNDLLISRINPISNKIFSTSKSANPKKDYYLSEYGDTYSSSCLRLKQSFFKVKDTLQPIEEYIVEIKESEAYKDYIKLSKEL